MADRLGLRREPGAARGADALGHARTIRGTLDVKCLLF